jgi:hypothetical protein
MTASSLAFLDNLAVNLLVAVNGNRKKMLPFGGTSRRKSHADFGVLGLLGPGIEELRGFQVAIHFR